MWSKEDRSYKSLLSRETTDSVGKAFYNELPVLSIASAINIHASNVWSDTIAFNNPSQAIIDGVAELKTLFALVEDFTVPNHQCWKVEDPPGTRLLNWISDKYGNSYTIHLFDNSGNEIFTTDLVGWFFDYQTGILTFNGDVSGKAKPFKITGYRYIGNTVGNVKTYLTEVILLAASDPDGTVAYAQDTGNFWWRRGGLWEEASQEAMDLATREPLTILVDYNAPTAVDPPAETSFSTQNEINAFLSNAGATSFKHLDRLWRALPIIIRHNVVINLAAGVHRPSGDVINIRAWSLSGKFTVSRLLATDPVTIRVNGALPSAYLPIVGTFGSPLSITGFDSGSASLNPSLTFSGTPFVGLDLKGRYAVLNTGQASIIHDHTDSVLYVTSQISPVPATCWVGRQSTILRNSLNDSTPVRTGAVNIGYMKDGTFFYLQDVSIEGFGGNGIHLQFDNVYLTTVRVLLNDQDPYLQFGILPNGRAFQNGFFDTRFAMQSSGYLGVPGVGGNDGVALFNNTAFISMADCYFKGGSYGVYYLQVIAANISNTVFDRNSTISGNAALQVSGVQCFQTWSLGGKRNEIRGATSVAGLLLMGNTQMPSAITTLAFFQYASMMFRDCTVPCIVLRSGARLDCSFGSTSNDLVDGGGNTSYGIVFEEDGCTARLNATTTVTGALGDVQMADGDVWSYANILAQGPVVDPFGNIVRKV